MKKLQPIREMYKHQGEGETEYIESEIKKTRRTSQAIDE